MKPKTKREREVDALFHRLYPDPKRYVSPSFRDWVEKKIIKPIAFSSGHKGWCASCGHQFQVEADGGTVVCPHCGKTCQIQKSRKKNYYSISYLQDVTYSGEWQIINTYTLEESCRAGRKEFYWMNRVYTWFINAKREKFLFSAGLKMNAYRTVNPWSQYDDGLHLRKKSKWAMCDFHSGYLISGVYPHGKIHPFLKKYGLKASTFCIDAYILFNAVQHDNKAETLLKIGQTELLNYHICRHIGDEQWRKVKIALRHGFDFSKPTAIRDWFDHLHLLEMLKMDTNNPKFICPENFDEQHRILNERYARKLEIERRENIRKQKEEIARRDKEAADLNSKKNVKYRNRIGKRLAVEVVSGDLTLKPMQSIKEFIDVATELSICVYSAKYYEKENSLILVAKISGEVQECIEVDTKQWKIIQCRGKHNQDSKFHNRILTTMQDNIVKFRRAQ